MQNCNRKVKCTFVNRKNIKPKKYITHDNGGRSFLVNVSKDIIQIYKSNFNFDYEPKKSDFTILVKEFNNFDGYWYGLDNSYKNIKINGTSILIQIKPKEYIIVGTYVIKFVTNEPIIEFRSPMGNSDVIYSYAWSENKIFNLIDKKISYMNKKDYIHLEIEKSVWQGGFYNVENKNDIKNLRRSKILHKRIF